MRLTLVILATPLVCSRLPASAAEGGTEGEAELRRKAQEVERLRQELDRAQADLKRLESENQRLRAEQTNPPTAPGAAAPAPSSKPAPALSTLAPVRPEETIDAGELAGQFRADPSGARARYLKRTFRVSGEIVRFGTKMVVRYYDVVLQTPERSIAVVCSFNYLDRYRSVYTRDSGELLVGVVGERQEVPLLKVGDRVVIEGTCEGLEDRRITFRRCRRLKE